MPSGAVASPLGVDENSIHQPCGHERTRFARWPGRTARESGRPQGRLPGGGVRGYQGGMRAAIRERYGPPSVIRVVDIPKPHPRAGEVLVRIHAAAVSRTDCAFLAARPAIMRLMFGLVRPRITTLGTDYAGVVEAVGAGVYGFEVGDRVWGINDLGAQSHAEYAVVPVGNTMARMPSACPFAEAVACIEGAWYAYSMMMRTRLSRGQRVLINGATGAIGSALLQLCVHNWNPVTAVGNTRNLPLLTQLGAERVLDYEKEDFTQDPHTYDVVFDAVGKSTFGACRRLLAPNGVYCSSELGPWAENLLYALWTPGPGKHRVVFPVPMERRALLEKMRRLVDDGHFRPVIDRTFTLDEIQDAYRYAESGLKTGNVVVRLA